MHHFACEQTVKKSKKWACKLCGEKQSLLKVFGQGSGADCRHHVQKLNLLQGEVGEAASSTAGHSCQNAISGSDVDDDNTQQRLGISQERVTMSRWNKYLEEKSDNACEEEESQIDTDQQKITPSTIRKRKKILQYGCGLDDQNTKGVVENIPKKNRICEGASVSTTGAIQPSCMKIEDLGSSKCNEKTVVHTLPVIQSQSRWQRFLSINKPEEKSEENISSIPSFHKEDLERDTALNRRTLENNKGPAWLSASDQLSETDTFLAHKVCTSVQETGLYSVDLRAGASSSLSKPFTQSNIFHTDEDFDDNY
ncbi:MRN complex-interacting protein isoform X2 [Mixophyes fleayi]|uniref:MRN complex-interacting protein isoform X2 n=1 Tax=Mixophyes fleayi TaxID=3061075 RepID=UPI003F4E41C3